MKKSDIILNYIENHGIKAIGRKEMISHLAGEHLSIREMVIAKCYDCMGYYPDGTEGCNIPECPLYPLQPYRGGDPYVSKNYSPEVKEAMAARAKLIQAKRSAAKQEVSS